MTNGGSLDVSRVFKVDRGFGRWPRADTRSLTMLEASIALKRIYHWRFVVGNARQSAYFYRNAFGFEVVGYAGLETRMREEAGYVLRQGKITYVLNSPLGPRHADNARLV